MATSLGQRFVRRHNAARTSTSNTTAADISYDTSVLSEGGYSWSSPEATVDTAGKYLTIFDIGQVDIASTRAVGTLVPAINTVQQERFRATHRYLRNSGGSQEGASIGMAILDLAASDDVKVRNPGVLTPTDALGVYGTNASYGGALQMIYLGDGNITHVERTVDQTGITSSLINTTRPWIDSSGTWTKVTFDSEVADDDTLYPGTGGDITLSANKKYMIVWGTTIYSASSGRMTHVTALNIDGSRVQTGTGYHRNTASQGTPANGMYLHEVGGTAETLYLEATTESETSAGNGIVSDAYMQVIELPDSAEWIHVDNGATDSMTTALAGLTTWYDTPLSSTLRADGDSNLSLDGTNNAVQNDSGASLPLLAIGWHRWDRDSGSSGTRKNPWTRWDNGGSAVGYGVAGAYSRGQQSTTDTFQAHYCSAVTMDLADGADLSFQANDEASATQADMGIYASTNRYFLGVQVLNLESLIPSASTLTKTFTTDAIVKEINTDTFTVDGIIKEINTDTFTTDLVVKEVNTDTFTTDGIISNAIIDATTSDELLLESGDIILEESGYSILLERSNANRTLTTNCIIYEPCGDNGNDSIRLTEDSNERVTELGDFRVTEEEAHTINKCITTDAIIIEGIKIDTFTTDGIIVDRTIKTFTTDSVIKVVKTKTFTTDAIIKEINTDTFTTDLVVKEINIVTISTDGFVQEVFEKTFTTDAIIKEQVTKTFTTNGLIKGGGLDFFTTDGYVRDTFVKTFTTDAIIKEAPTDTFTTDGIVVARTIKTVTVDGIIKVINTKTFTTDTIIAEINADSFTVDGIVLAKITKTITTDGIIKTIETKTFTTDAIVKEINTDSLTVDGIVMIEIVKTFTTDAIVKEINTETFTTNGIVKVATIDTFTVDCIVEERHFIEATTDAIIKAIEAKTFTTNAIVKEINTNTFTTDGLVKIIQSETVTTDAIVKEAIEKTFTTDGVIKTINTETFTTDAVIAARLSDTFTTDAIVKVSTLKTFTVDAGIFAENTESFTTDGFVREKVCIWTYGVKEADATFVEASDVTTNYEETSATGCDFLLENSDYILLENTSSLKIEGCNIYSEALDVDTSFDCRVIGCNRVLEDDGRRLLEDGDNVKLEGCEEWEEVNNTPIC